MKKVTIVCGAVLMALFIIAASASSTDENGETRKRYGIEKALVEYKIESDMFSGTEQLYFDHYGRQEAKYSHQVIEVMGMKQENHTATFIDLDVDDQIYTYDFKTKTGTKTENPFAETLKSKSMKELGEEMMMEMGGKKVGTEEFLGKTCDVWEIPDIGKSWVWNWINLKTESSAMGIKMTIEATSISEEFDSAKLEKPEAEYKDGGSMMDGLEALQKLKKN